ncbi:MAG: TrmH family RNA methyltransferase [Endomicrobiaceae bacterium]
MFIESAHNKIIKQIFSLHDKKSRDEQSLFIVEGYKQVKCIPSDWHIEYIIRTEKYKDTDFNSPVKYSTTDAIFKKISETETPQGILAVVKKQKNNLLDALNEKGIFILIDSLQDPGNLGSIIRTAEAYNCRGLFLSANTADPFSGKVVRSSMGSIFRVPVFQENDLIYIIKKIRDKNIKTYALSLQTDNNLGNISFNESAAVIVGNEANGISPDILKNADELVKIEMPGKTQSLNAAIACSIAVYEIFKQIK